MTAAVGPAGRNGVVPSALRPLYRAYILAHLTTTGPRLFGFLRVVIRKDLTLQGKLRLLYTIIRSSFQLNRFPPACAVIVGGATALPRLIKSILQWLLQEIKNDKTISLSPSVLSQLRYICSFLSAWLAFSLLNQDERWSRKRATSRALKQQELEAAALEPQVHDYVPPPLPLPSTQPLPSPKLAGKTIDFTLFALTRALDALFTTLWTATQSSPRHPFHSEPKLTHRLMPLIDPILFSASTSLVMWSWFYHPTRLPKSYNAWLSAAASIDKSLIQSLRLTRQNILIYGRDTGHESPLGPLCQKVGVDPIQGDMAATVPIPCTVIHSGTGHSCEYHALQRLRASFRFAMKLYLPIQLLTQLRTVVGLIRRGPSQPLGRTLRILRHLTTKVLRAAIRSSLFLAALVATFYYAVCLTRTRVGPYVLRPIIYYFPSLIPSPPSPNTTTPSLNSTTTASASASASEITIAQALDSGLSVLSGCLLCGWSIFLESPSRRTENMQFVAPKALATLLPRVYDARYRWREQLCFAGSVAVVVGGVADGNGRNVRGVFGRAVRGLLA